MSEKGKTVTTDCKFKKRNNEKILKYLDEKIKETECFCHYYSWSIDTNWPRQSISKVLLVKKYFVDGTS